MRKKNLIGLVVIILAVVFIATIAVTGFGVGIYNVVPIPSLVKRGVELDGGTSVIFRAVDPMDGTDIDSALDVVVKKQQLRLSEGGYSDAVVARQGSDRILVEMPNGESTASMVSYLGSIAEVTFQDEDGNVILSGKSIAEASYGYSNSTDQTPTVSFSLDEEGKATFAEATSQMVGKTLKIYVDEELVTSAKISEKITTGIVSISVLSGGIERARQIAAYISSGTLPIAVEAEEIRTVEPIMNTSQTIMLFAAMGAAAIIALVLFMLQYKPFPGFIAWFTVVIDMFALMFVLPTIRSLVFTVSGFYAIALVFVLECWMMARIFSGFRNAANNGAKPKAAWKTATDQAFYPVIMTSAVFAFVSVALLFSSTTSLSSFGRVLLTGTLTSTFVGLFVVNGLMKLAFGIAQTNTDILVKPEKAKNEKKLGAFLAKRGWILAVAVIIAGVAFACVGGLNYGTDVAGGHSVTLTTDGDSFDVADATAAAEYAGIQNFEIEEIVSRDDGEMDENTAQTSSVTVSSANEFTYDQAALMAVYLNGELGYANTTAGTVNTVEPYAGIEAVIFSAATALAVILVTMLFLFVAAGKAYGLASFVSSIVTVLSTSACAVMLGIVIDRTSITSLVIVALLSSLTTFGMLISHAKRERAYTCASTLAALIAGAFAILMTIVGVGSVRSLGIMMFFASFFSYYAIKFVVPGILPLTGTDPSAPVQKKAR